MSPTTAMHLPPRDGGDPDQNASGPGLNPSLIVGICILGGVFFCVILATVMRLCQSRDTSPDEQPANLFCPHTQSQVERMREVRWVNLNDVWEESRRYRTNMGEQFGPKPKFNRRTGVGWGLQGDFYADGGRDFRQGQDAWSSQGTSGESRKSMVNDTPLADQPCGSYYEDSNPQTYRSHTRPPPSPRCTTYEDLDRSDDEDQGEHITEPFPDLPTFPAFETRLGPPLRPQGSPGKTPLRTVRNDDGYEQVSLTNTPAVQKPRIPFNGATDDLATNPAHQRYSESMYSGDGYGVGTGPHIEMRDLTYSPARQWK